MSVNRQAWTNEAFCYHDRRKWSRELFSVCLERSRKDWESFNPSVHHQPNSNFYYKMFLKMLSLLLRVMLSESIAIKGIITDLFRKKKSNVWGLCPKEMEMVCKEQWEGKGKILNSREETLDIQHTDVLHCWM